MAKFGRNLVTARLSGKLGDLIVFRTRGDVTYMASRPKKNDKEPTPGQIEHRLRFQEAIIYGKQVNADPALKENYSQSADGNQSAYNVAVADFMKAPHIDEIDVTRYNGQAGGSIRIRAVDDFRVVQAAVSIFNADSTLVEEGNAQQQANGIDWIYTATAQNGSIAGDKIIIKVSDTPGNITLEEKSL
jgi:hypothetical protein